MRAPRLLLCLSLVGLACAVHLDGDRDGIDEAIDRAAAEVNVHYVELMDAASLAEGRAEIDRYAPRMRARLDEVWRRLDASGCFEGGGSMYGMVEVARQRLDAYLAEADAASSLSELRDACERYGDDMDQLLGRMMGRWTAMWCP